MCGGNMLLPTNLRCIKSTWQAGDVCSTQWGGVHGRSQEDSQWRQAFGCQVLPSRWRLWTLKASATKTMCKTTGSIAGVVQRVMRRWPPSERFGSAFHVTLCAVWHLHGWVIKPARAFVYTHGVEWEVSQMQAVGFCSGTTGCYVHCEGLQWRVISSVGLLSGDGDLFGATWSSEDKETDDGVGRMEVGVRKRTWKRTQHTTLKEVDVLLISKTWVWPTNDQHCIEDAAARSDKQ